MSCCVGSTNDGAANIQGRYNGFSAFYQRRPPTKSMSGAMHVLNLVLADTTGSIIQSASLFSLLNDIAVFIRDSYKRMKIGEGTNRQVAQKTLSNRREWWWTKDAALTNVVFWKA